MHLWYLGLAHILQWIPWNKVQDRIQLMGWWGGGWRISKIRITRMASNVSLLWNLRDLMDFFLTPNFAFVHIEHTSKWLEKLCSTLNDRHTKIYQNCVALQNWNRCSNYGRQFNFTFAPFFVWHLSYTSESYWASSYSLPTHRNVISQGSQSHSWVPLTIPGFTFAKLVATAK